VRGPPGYALLFLGVAFEGEAVLLAAALLAARGFFRLPVVIAVAVAANTVADQAYFQLARLRGRAWLERRFGSHPRYQQLIALVGRRGSWLLFASRFAYGLRIAIPAACGALGMGVVPFTLVDLLAGLVWAVPMGLAGYFAGGALAPLLEGVRRYEEAIALVLVVSLAAWLGVRHVRRLVRWRELRWADLHALVPFLVGLMGVLNLLSAIWPREPAVMRQLEQWLPLEVTQPSRALMLFAGVALLQVTRNLSRRKALAWWVAVAALSVSLVSHAGRAFDVHHSLVAALLLAYLIVFRRRFTALTDPASLRQALVMAPVLGAVVWVFGTVGLVDLRDQFTWHEGSTPALEEGAALRVVVPATRPGVEDDPHASAVGSLEREERRQGERGPLAVVVVERDGEPARARARQQRGGAPRQRGQLDVVDHVDRHAPLALQSPRRVEAAEEGLLALPAPQRVVQERAHGDPALAQAASELLAPPGVALDEGERLVRDRHRVAVAVPRGVGVGARHLVEVGPHQLGHVPAGRRLRVAPGVVGAGVVDHLDRPGRQGGRRLRGGGGKCGGHQGQRERGEEAHARSSLPLQARPIRAAGRGAESVVEQAIGWSRQEG